MELEQFQIAITRMKYKIDFEGFTKKIMKPNLIQSLMKKHWNRVPMYCFLHWKLHSQF